MATSAGPLITDFNLTGETGKITDFKLPPPDAPMRVRPAAHFVNEGYMAKYKKAIELMKALPDDDPRRNFDQVWSENLDRLELLQDPNSRIIIPHFNRIYLYFYERFLGNLIDDPTFALPYWGWDSDSGMTIPPMFAEFGSSFPPTTTLLDVPEIVSYHHANMYRQVVSGANTPKLFFGSTLYRAGDEPEPVPGAFENLLHTWSGLSDDIFPEDSNTNFYTSGRDVVLYGLPANVDRMMTVWESRVGGRLESMDPDWIEYPFLVNDDYGKLVRVKIRDCLDNRKLRYTYQELPIRWLDSRPKPKVRNTGESSKTAAELRIGTGDFPRFVDSVINVEVPRPRKSRSLREKEDEEEVLLIRGIEVDTDAFVKFDVYINDEDHSVTSPIHTEFAGSFMNRPYKHMQGMNEKKKKKTSWMLGINETLEDLGAEDDDSLIVTIVPRAGTVTIGGVEIEFLSD